MQIHNNEIVRLKIHETELKKFDATENKFLENFQFSKCSIVEASYIKYNNFEKCNFSNSCLGDNSKLSFNDFNNTSIFENLRNLKKSTLKIQSCKFNKYTYFNGSQLNHLHIDTSRFSEFTSFQETEFNSIFIDRTIFLLSVFFDEIKIHSPKKCSKRTFRIIKEQLINTNNQIDSYKFKSYELGAYKEELKKKNKQKNSKTEKKEIRRDLIILKLNSFFSNNGTDWLKAIKRTLFISLLFYAIFFLTCNYYRELELVSFSSYNEFFTGFFRFLLLTDFHDPLSAKKVYLTSAIEWIPFIIGKLLIGIGIFETIISFRKFKK